MYVELAYVNIFLYVTGSVLIFLLHTDDAPIFLWRPYTQTHNRIETDYVLGSVRVHLIPPRNRALNTVRMFTVSVLMSRVLGFY